MNSPNWTIIVVIIIFCIGYIYYRKKTKFDPFKVHIFPKWSLILKDFSRYNEKEIVQLIEKHEKDASHVLNNGLTFTVLKSSEDSKLIFNNNHKTFHSKVDFREVIDEIKLYLSSPDDSPEFYVKEDITGYTLGITNESGEIPHCSDGQNLIDGIATLPYSLFHMPALKYGTINPKKLENKLAEYGWEIVESEGPLKTQDELNHRYFKIYYEDI